MNDLIVERKGLRLSAAALSFSGQDFAERVVMQIAPSPLNDGHEAGDAVLQAAAGRMLATMRADDTVARLAGDEFVVIAQAVANQASARDIARKLCDVLSAPISVENAEVAVGASIGVYLNLSGHEPQSAEQALALADKAMYEAKRSGRNRFSLVAD
ncbi:TPA: GGDEF domain-containing protein [Pseudomonas putida]|uniref:diguanylate cyclase domain-containing protein n=1 Tax=Pseudomonas putida TaxID=303 RepID=UPI0023644202|nr:GGDEF domain-containing protein [Pseudomonas putida]MDD2151308.1 GGDEF domain-containing protein [Pseudomonas putida]HDS1680681.1 GGDEF domain-containing protein [Pseudomonas putida]